MYIVHVSMSLADLWGLFLGQLPLPTNLALMNEVGVGSSTTKLAHVGSEGSSTLL